MIKGILLTGVSLLLLGSIATAGSDWLHFIDTEKGEKCYIDLDSIKRVSSDVVTVSRMVEPKSSSDVVSRVSHLEMDCRSNRMRVLKEIIHYRNGKSGSAAGDRTFRNVSPADFEESLMELVCSLKKRKQ